PLGEEDPEEELQDEPEPEVRHAVADEGEERPHLVEGAVAPYRGVDPEGYPYQGGDDERRAQQQHGGPDPGDDDVVDRGVLLEAQPEVAVQHDVADLDQVLHHERFVETVLVAYP